MLRIKQERLNAKWTQLYIARKIGLTRTAVSEIETGKQLPSYKILIKLENLFNLSHRELFQEAGLPNE